MLKTFYKGGIHPPENKITNAKEIKKLPVPKTVYVPVSQHIGIPSEIIVAVKEKVIKGQVIAKSGGFISAAIHTPVTGTVTKLDKFVDSTGYKTQCIVIRTDLNADENFEQQYLPLKNEIDLEPHQILERIEGAGIVGLGGATFPAHVKLKGGETTKLDYLIVNGVECEPYLTADHRLMLEKADEILVGIQIILRALGIEKAIIGIENNKKNALQLFKKITKNEPRIAVAALQVKYPQGGEKQLIKALLNREVPENGLPLNVGVVVHNVGTVFAIYEAVQYNLPLTERVVTVTGKDLKEPGNFWVKIGTPVNDLISAVGGLPHETGKVLNGGPMMGKALKSFDVPVTKGTSGILLLNESENRFNEVFNCIRCGACVTVCPMGLEPFLLQRLAEKRLFHRAMENAVLSCIECGSCSYACPSNRPLLEFIRLGKSESRKLQNLKN
jgi:electron transport complex protein RnfC